MLDRLRHATDVAKFKADQLLRVNRVQAEISNARREVQVVRDQIASAALELHRGGSLQHAEIEQLCVAIDRLNALISEREALVVAIQAEQPPTTTATVTYAATASAIQPAVQSAAQPPIRPTHACPHCGFGAPLHAAFCPSCGKALPAVTEPSTPDSIDQDTTAQATQPEVDQYDAPNNPADQSDTGG
jgi:hypothetical protein